MLLETEPPNTIPSEQQVGDCSRWISPELYSDTEKLYSDTDSVLGEIGASGDISSVFSTSYTGFDAVLGPVFELKSNTPVPDSDFQPLGEFFWRHLTAKSDAVLPISRGEKDGTTQVSKSW